MTVPIMFDLGEEFFIKNSFRTDTITRPTTVSVTAYNDGTDLLGEGSDIGNVTTEPAGASWARQSLSLDTVDFTLNDNANGNWEVQMADLTFDASDSSQTVDALIVLAAWTADDTADAGSTTHAIFAVPIEDDTGTATSVNLSNYSGNITFSGMKYVLD